jgi:hypothetical protein
MRVVTVFATIALLLAAFAAAMLNHDAYRKMRSLGSHKPTEV